MLVKDLIKLLQMEDQEAPVVFAYDYGDRGHTQAAMDVREVCVRDLYETAYSPSGLAITDPDDDRTPEQFDVVVLS